MPELPEVETVMRGLAALAEGRVISRAEARRPDLRRPLPERFADRLTGRRIEGFRRRAKYILMRLSDGESLLIHLGMSGRMVAQPAGVVLAPREAPHGRFSDMRGNSGAEHEHVVMVLDDGMRIGFVDPRRFGSMDLVPTAAEDAHPLLAGLGPEPLSDAFTPALLSAALSGKRTPIKAALLDQGVVAGLGNIYVCEALYRARISPRRSALSVPGVRAARLVPAIREVLAEAIGAGGSSLRDYVQADGDIGRFQENFAVYGREGEPCPSCTGAPCRGVQRIVQAGRSTFFCARRQT
jgi:formamidopyrimidine-DNA glycosylase